MVLGLVAIGLLFGAGGMWLAERAAPTAAMDEARVGRIVRDYVLAHPELIPEAIEKLQQRESTRAVASNRSRIEQPYGDAWIGNPNADVTLVEYYDYNCGFCRATLPTIEKLVAADKNLRVVFKELPVLADSSRAAARASLTAAAQGRFKSFHDALYAAGPVSAATIAQAAKASGVDLTKVPADTEATLRDNLDIAAKLGVTGTPAWVVGDQLLSGALPLDRLQDAIAKARAS
ncbi:disulfide bond formation protein DsbA [Sphingomonas sp. Leaf231]|nr:disulfide bond formation protein DsbA [Sphingomonas sp. Leaf231]